MARAVRASGSPRSRNAPLPAASERGAYLREVWDELKKVLWPTRAELTRMTGIVMATVIMFAAIIGIADYGLGLVVKQLYAAPGTASHAVPARPAQLPSATARARPSVRAPAASVPAAPAASVPAAPGAPAPARP